MAARQFGFVVARGLAIYCLILGLNHIYIFAMQMAQLQLMRQIQQGRDSSPWTLYVNITMTAAFVLLAAFLWTTADRFSGTQADSVPTLRSGNWVVRIAFTCLGILIVTFALNTVASVVANMAFPDPMRKATRESYIEMGVGLAKLAIGLGLIFAYRFDKGAAIEAAQATEAP